MQIREDLTLIECQNLCLFDYWAVSCISSVDDISPEIRSRICSIYALEIDQIVIAMMRDLMIAMLYQNRILIIGGGEIMRTHCPFYKSRGFLFKFDDEYRLAWNINGVQHFDTLVKSSAILLDYLAKESKIIIDYEVRL